MVKEDVFDTLAKELYSQDSDIVTEKPSSDPWNDLATSPEFQKEQEESFLKSAARTALQIPQGILEGTKYGIGAGLFQLLSSSDLDVEEFHKLRQLAEEKGETFNEEAYNEAGQQALGMVPTISNIASAIEERTGIPLEPKTRTQKGLRFLSAATKLTPANMTIRGMETALPRPVIGAALEGTKEVLQEAGVPEPIAEAVSFGILKKPPEGAPKLEIGKKTKPSGLPERRFETNPKTRQVSERNLNNINDTLEKDFRKVSDKIIKESPIGETAKNLKDEPNFKQESRELLDEAQKIADKIPNRLDTQVFKNELDKVGKTREVGFIPNDYDKKYKALRLEAKKGIKTKDTSYGDLVKQYRKNNADLGQYFEPGLNKLQNNAKRDALLDQNIAIANVMEKSHPELAKVFKEGNARWTKIMDAEMVDDFVNELFSGKVNFKNMHDFFDKRGYDRNFTKALGRKGYNQFENLLQDMLKSENAYNKLKLAKSKGYDKLFKTGLSYVINPKLGYVRGALDAVKFGYRSLVNEMLHRPNIGITYRKGVRDLMKNDFEGATKQFDKLEKEIGHKKPNHTEANPKTNEVRSKLEEELRQARTESLEARRKQLAFVEKNGANMQPVEEYELLENARKAMEKEMKILTKLRETNP